MKIFEIKTNFLETVLKRWTFKLFSIVLIHLHLLSFGQKSTPEFIYDEAFLGKDFLEKNFEGGYVGYTDFFEANLTFPQSSYKSKIEGLQLFYYDIYPSENKVEVTFLTLLDKEIEENIRATVVGSFKHWNLKGEDQDPYRIYQPIVYSMMPSV